MRGVTQHGASVVPVVPNLTAPFNDAQTGAKSETDAPLRLPTRLYVKNFLPPTHNREPYTTREEFSH